MLYPSVILTNYKNKGFGLYTTEKIPAGSVVWLPCKNCLSFNTKFFESMTEDEINYLEDKAYYMENGDLLIPDGISRFMNHSCEAKILEYGLDFGIAVKDILPGEEITSDYRRWLNDKPWSMKCYCGEESCTGTISPTQGYDINLQKMWGVRIKKVLPELIKINQPLHDISMECSHIYKDIINRKFEYLKDPTITIRNPKYLVYLSKKEYYFENIEEFEDRPIKIMENS